MENCKESECTVIVPTLNEEGTIARLLDELESRYPEIRVMVADDNSTDNTGKIVSEKNESNPNISLLSRVGVPYRGITASVLDAVEKVETPFFLVMDGDLQHPPHLIVEFLKELKNHEIVVARRLPYKENQGLHRIAFTRVATKLAKLVLQTRGIQINDPMSGFFAAKTNLIKGLIQKHRPHFEEQGYKVLFDLLRVTPKEITIAEIPYQFGMRDEGSSKLRARHALYFLRSLFH